MRARVRSAICAAALVCGSCSRVVGELDLQCVEQSDCDALNEAEGLNLEEDCFVYQCRSDARGCEKRAQDLDKDGSPAKACTGKVVAEIDCDDTPGSGTLRNPWAEEDCDGVDNDCDELIDEDALSHSFSRSMSYPLGEQEIVHLSHTHRDQQLRVASTSRDGTTFTTNVWRYDVVKPELTFEAEVAVSRRSEGEWSCEDRQCSFTELVLAAGPGIFLALGVNQLGCASGEVRAGGAGRGSLARGEGSLRWAAAVSDCRSGRAEGASRTSLGILEMATYDVQALALWRGAPGDSHVASPLVGNGLWVEPRGDLPPDILATTGTHAERVAGSEGQDAAAVAAWAGRDRTGYFVAYDTAETVEIRFVPRLASPTTPAMSDWLRAPALKEAKPRHVALALGAQADAALDRPAGLAAVWRTEAGDVRFSRISFDGEATPALRATTPETLQSSARIVGGPKIVYLPQGFVQPAYTDDIATGGWFVTWVEQTDTGTRVMGARVPEQLTDPEAREEPFTILAGERQGHLFTYPAGQSRPGYGFVESGAREQTLHIGSLACPVQN